MSEFINASVEEFARKMAFWTLGEKDQHGFKHFNDFEVNFRMNRLNQKDGKYFIWYDPREVESYETGSLVKSLNETDKTIYICEINLVEIKPLIKINDGIFNDSVEEDADIEFSFTDYEILVDGLYKQIIEAYMNIK